MMNDDNNNNEDFDPSKVWASEPKAQDGQQGQPAKQINDVKPSSGSAAGPESVVDSPVQSAAQTATKSPKKKSKKKMMIIGGLVSVLLLGGIGAGVYAYLYNNHPDKIVADAMFGSIEDVIAQKPLDMAGEMTYKIAGTGAEALSMNVQLNSKTSGQDASGDVSAKLSYAGQDFDLQIAGASFGDNEMYFKVSNLKETFSKVSALMPILDEGAAAQLAPMIEKLDGTWVKISEQDLGQLGLVDTEGASECTKAASEIKISEQDDKNITKLYKDNQFVTVTEKMGSEEVRGEDSYHYKLGFDQESAKTFAKEAIKLDSLKNAVEKCNVKEADIEKAFMMLSDTTGQITKNDGSASVEVWINKNTRRPTQMKLSGDDKGSNMSMMMQTKFDAESLVIEKPTDSISMQDLMKELQGAAGLVDSTVLTPQLQ